MAYVDGPNGPEVLTARPARVPYEDPTDYGIGNNIPVGHIAPKGGLEPTVEAGSYPLDAEDLGPLPFYQEGHRELND